MVKTPKRKRLTQRKKKSTTVRAKANTTPSRRLKSPENPKECSSSTIQCTTSPSSSNATLPVDTPTPASRTTTNDDVFSSASQHNREQLEESSSEDDDDDVTRIPSLTLPNTPTTAERIRVTRKNAVYNVVLGAMRGSKALEIPRTRPLREPIDDIARNTRCFNRIVTDIIMRCERLGEETGCWLLFLAQLPSSKALTHYSSSRLRREAKTDTLRLINQYQTLIRTLLAAKRDEAVTIQKHYEQAQRDLESAQQAKAVMEAELARKDTELQNLRASRT
ncbi:hypothetical protein H0H92_010429 [Tricholoma furcatifolium]|nr:hypothetical protein H0H92_010429 [Tricholoma furcatifolium]